MLLFVPQTRLTADRSMRLLLSTFSSLREDLLHMSEDLRVKTKAISCSRRRNRVTETRCEKNPRSEDGASLHVCMEAPLWIKTALIEEALSTKTISGEKLNNYLFSRFYLILVTRISLK